MSTYQEIISVLNNALITTMTGSVLIRDDGVIAVNPKNPDHYQGNVFYRIRLEDVKDLSKVVEEANEIFQNVSCVPRFNLDECSKPSFESLWDEFKKLGFKSMEVSNDSILSWSMQHEKDLVPEMSGLSMQQKEPAGTCRSATADDVEEISDVIAVAFGYHTRNYDWLRYIVKRKLNMPDTYHLFVNTIRCGDREVVGAITILLTPPGLPHLGLVNSVSTHPDYQRRGLGKQCLMYALRKVCTPIQTFYLETFDETHHAFRMYKSVGFKFEGICRNATITMYEEED